MRAAPFPGYYPEPTREELEEAERSRRAADAAGREVVPSERLRPLTHEQSVRLVAICDRLGITQEEALRRGLLDGGAS